MERVWLKNDMISSLRIASRATEERHVAILPRLCTQLVQIAVLRCPRRLEKQAVAKVDAKCALLDRRFLTKTTTLRSISPWLGLKLQLAVACGWPRTFTVDSIGKIAQCSVKWRRMLVAVLSTNAELVVPDLKIAAYLNDTIPSEDCPAAFQLAQDENCCTPVRTYDSCDFCGGDATFYPDNWVFKIGSCSYVQSLFSDAFCSQYTPIYAPLCCGPVPEGSAGSSPTSPPSSASTSRSTLVTIMGLTTVAAGALVMNE
jgi:hypothetical protein